MTKSSAAVCFEEKEVSARMSVCRKTDTDLGDIDGGDKDAVISKDPAKDLPHQTEAFRRSNCRASKQEKTPNSANFDPTGHSVSVTRHKTDKSKKSSLD